MKVKELIDLLAVVPGDTLIVVGSTDHSYREAKGELTPAIFEWHHISEDFGEDFCPLEPGQKRIQVVAFR